MLFNVGDLVTRNSYNNDIVFKIIDIKDNKVILEGINVRLVADSSVDDLKKCDDCIEEVCDDNEVFDRLVDLSKLNRDEYFYLPGKILHIDADKEYLNRCMKFYKKMDILSYGFVIEEKDVPRKIYSYLSEINPDIVVITGHDAFYNKNSNKNDPSNYKNSDNFIMAVKEARRYEKSHDKLVIIAGACQSDYEDLIKAGANFASSPKRVNIHALDPAIIASSISLSDKGKNIDLLEILNKTKYKTEGMGGIITCGMMYTGYPR